MGVRRNLTLLVVAAALAATLVPATAGPTSPAFVGAPAVSQPLPDGHLPTHPFMSDAGANSMHGDGYASDTHPFSGPLGRSPKVVRANKNTCAAMTFTHRKLAIVQCGGVQAFTMRLLDPTTLTDLATYDLPPRPSTFRAVANADFDAIYSDSSGAYFYLDERDRFVVADASQHVQRVRHEQAADGTWRFVKEADWDLTPLLPHDCESPTNPRPAGECDAVSAILPDYQGLMWWVTRKGRIGTINPASGAIKVLRLPGEEIQNSHAVGEDGVYVVSDKAMYRLSAGADGTPTIGWRETYDRGTARKTGQINQGSGTTPTLLGEDYVAITDNADDRMHVLVYRRTGPAARRLVCSVPVFGSGASATENSLVGWDNGFVVENNAGYRDPRPVLGRTTVAGGLAKVEVLPGGKGCRTAWTSTEHSPSVVPKLSRGNGLLYVYTHEEAAAGIDDAWYLTAIDFRTGRTAYKVYVGDGPIHDNAWLPVTLGPDGSAYVGLLGQLIAVRDTA
jgi:hypothetical protein